MENIKIVIPKIPTFKISLPQYGTGQSNIVVDSEMSDTSTNPVQNKIVKKYVDDGIIPKYEFWQSGKVYKVGSAVFALALIDNYVQTVGMICIKEHTSESVDIDIDDGYWDVQLFVANASVKDAFGNIIHETYVKKKNGYGLADIERYTDTDGKKRNHIEIEYDNSSTNLSIPAYTSDLDNDSGFITSDNLQAEIEKIFPNGDVIGYPTANKEGD